MKARDDEMNDPRRVAVRKEFATVRAHIVSAVKSDGSVRYLLAVLPPLLKKLETAYNNIFVLEGIMVRDECQPIHNENGT